jgi:signal transduction histidine kinase
MERLGVRVSIVELVANLGGDAHVESAPGAGTTVVIRWPSLDRADAAMPTPSAESETAQ